MSEDKSEPCGKEWSHQSHYHGVSLRNAKYCRGVHRMVEIPEDLIEDIQYRLRMYNSATDKTNEGHHLIELFNHVSDLSSYHGGYSNRSGTLPWEREDAE